MSFSELIDSRQRPFEAIKRGGDILLAFTFLPVLAMFAVVLIVLNPFLNSGPLFFVQRRMGQGCMPFQMLKFRSIQAETGQITLFGKLLRKSRIDELPQAINVLRGEMSFVGPRPDAWDEAVEFARRFPGYRARHSVRPGISGLAQVRHGYIEGEDRLHLKIASDLEYIHTATVGLDLRIAVSTVATVFLLKGQ